MLRILMRVEEGPQHVGRVRAGGCRWGWLLGWGLEEGPQRAGQVRAGVSRRDRCKRAGQAGAAAQSASTPAPASSPPPPRPAGQGDPTQCAELLDCTRAMAQQAQQHAVPAVSRGRRARRRRACLPAGCGFLHAAAAIDWLPSRAPSPPIPRSPSLPGCPRSMRTGCSSPMAPCRSSTATAAGTRRLARAAAARPPLPLRNKPCSPQTSGFLSICDQAALRARLQPPALQPQSAPSTPGS